MAQRQTEKVASKSGKMPKIIDEKPAPDKKTISAGKQAELDNALVNAVSIGDNTETARLIKAGADVYAKDGNGDMPLHIAAYTGRNKICLLIMEEYAKAGGNVDELMFARASNGLTPMRVAVELKQFNTIRFLESIIKLSSTMGKEIFNSFLVSFAECTAG